MIKLIFKIPLIFCLASVSNPPNTFYLFRQYSTSQSTSKILSSLKPIKIYSSLHHPTKKAKMLNELANQGGILLFLSQNSSLYAIEGNGNLAGYLQDLFNKEMLTLLADIKIPKSIQKKSKIQLKTHYQELLHQDWKDYDLYLLELWKASEDVNIKHRLVYYHTKYQPKLNLFRYVSLANGEIEEVYQWNRFKTEKEMLAKTQKKATTKPLLIYRIDDKSPLNKLKAKVYYENKDKAGIYRWINRNTKESYIGCSLNLGQVLYSLDKIDYPLNKALKADGLTSFNLQILAHCNIEELAEKEQYYLNLYQPKYNLSTNPKNTVVESNAEVPMVEFSPIEQLSFFDDSFANYDDAYREQNLEDYEPVFEDKKEDPVIDNSFDKQLVLFKPPKQSLMTSKPSPGVSLTPLEVKPSSLIIIPEPIKEPIIEVKTKKTWTLSEATRLKQSLAQQKRTKHPRSGLAVQVLDLVTNKTTVYSSYWEAARALNISVKIISKYFSREQSKPYKKRYVFTKV